MTQNVKFIPDGYHSVQPYLGFLNSEKAIAFYQQAFGAIAGLCMKGEHGRVVHAEIRVGDSCIMLSDESPENEAFSPRHYGGSPVTLMLYVADCDATYRQALAAGATSVREPSDQPYGDRMCGVKDPFGYRWWIATHVKDVSDEELRGLA